ncbi:MAG: PAS domain S-box protein, partial [Tolypothrix sp. T3-bin4]|nr:PAS domain S-box protein [Tolypothrix sp. T3-bin4]
ELELHDVFENGPRGLHCLHANGMILWANQSELDLLGYTREEYVGHPAANFYADKAVIEDILKRLAANETLHNYEARMLCKDGSTRYVLINSNVLWEDGKFSHTRCFTRDITERKLAEEVLRQTQERFRNLVETSSDWVWEVDENAVYTYASPKVRDLLGYKPEEVIGKTLFDWMPAEEARRVAKIFAPLVAQALPFSCLENLNIHKDGHLVVLETSGIPFFNAEGRFRGYRGMDRDITRRKSVEAELRDLGAALENAVEGISRLDAQGRYIVVNKSYANTHGYEPEEMIGMEWQLTVHPEDLDKLTDAYQQMFVLGKVESEARGIRKGGEVFYKQVVMIAAYDGQKQFIGHHCFMKDISDRKRTEQKIREQAALLDVATEAIFVHSLDNKILFWNKGAERLYGWKREEVVGKNAWRLLYQNSQSQQEIHRALLERGEWQGELHKVTKDNRDIIVASRLTLVRDAQNQPKSILVVNTDITEKKQLEAQFLRTQRMESIGTLAGGIAHDLNNVLAPILMAIQLLQLKLTDERCQQWLDILETSARRGADLVKQVVSFARGMDGDRTIVQIRHIISEIRQIARETFPKSIKVYIDVSQDLWAVSGDATQLHQVLMNLCVNARDALPDGGTLSISAENLLIDEDYARMNIEANVGAYVVVTVSDTGIGIPKEILERIFEPFFTTKEIGKGTGLGLSTVLGIIKSHGGFINVYSEIGQGTEFRIYLP